MRLKCGDYVRTKNGEIHKVIEIKENRYITNFADYFYYRYDNNMDGFKSNIANHSKQLMELIEVKDLVCFKNKLQNSLENEEMIIHIFDNDTLEEVKQAIKKGEIELLEILTHEQFEQNSYKVGGE